MPGLFLALGYTALFLFAIRRWPFFQAPGLGRRTVGALFLVKIAAGTALWYVYTYLYTDRATADIYKYFDDGNVMFSALPAHPGDYLRMLFGVGNDAKHFDDGYYLVMNNWYRAYEGNLYNDAHTLIRFNAFVRLFSFGVYHVHTVFACFFGTIGLVALYKAFIPWLAGHARGLTAALFLLPSVLFWASGPIKETLLFFGLGLFLMNAFRALEGRLGLGGWGVLLLCTLLLFVLKFYVLLSMVPALFALGWCRRTGGRRPWMKFAAVYAAFLLAGLNSALLYPGFDMLEVLWVKQRDFIGMARAVSSGSLVEVTPLEPTVGSFLRQAPHALYMTFLSPLTMVRNGALGLMSAAENVLLVALVVLAFRYRRRWADVDVPLLLFSLGYCLLLGLVIGWTTPVIGALVRYRVPLLPFFCIALFTLTDPAKLPRWLSRP